MIIYFVSFPYLCILTIEYMTREVAHNLFESKYQNCLNADVEHSFNSQRLKIRNIKPVEDNNGVYTINFWFDTSFVDEKGRTGSECNHDYFDYYFRIT